MNLPVLLLVDHDATQQKNLLWLSNLSLPPMPTSFQ